MQSDQRLFTQRQLGYFQSKRLPANCLIHLSFNHYFLQMFKARSYATMAQRQDKRSAGKKQLGT